jgi:hypothetical protein
MSVEAEFKKELKELLDKYQVEISLVGNTISFFSYAIYDEYGDIKHEGVDFNGGFFSGHIV